MRPYGSYWNKASRYGGAGSGAEAAMSACGIRAGNGISDFKMSDNISAGAAKK